MSDVERALARARCRVCNPPVAEAPPTDEDLNAALDQWIPATASTSALFGLDRSPPLAPWFGRPTTRWQTLRWRVGSLVGRLARWIAGGCVE